MKIREVETEWLHADRRTDLTKLIVVFCDFANTPEVLLVTGDRSLKLVDYLQVQHADEIIIGLTVWCIKNCVVLAMNESRYRNISVVCIFRYCFCIFLECDETESLGTETTNRPVV